MIATKHCSTCGRERPLVLFAHDRNLPGGRARVCKACALVRAKRWRRENMGIGVGKMPGRDWLEWRRVRD